MPVAKETSPKENMKIYDQYEGLVKKYESIYGKNTIVAYHKGEFYQIFCADDDLVDIYRIAEDLNLNVTRQNKSNPVINRSNYRMIGWPTKEKKFIDIIIKKNYTLVMVEQFKKSEEEKKKGEHECERRVTRVLSKGTVLPELLGDDDIESGGQRITFGNAEDGRQGNYIYCIFVDFYTRPYDNVTYAVAIIDISTGFTHAYEIYPREEDPSYAIDELVRLRFQFPPLEVILVSREKKNDAEYDAVIKQLSEHVVQELKLKSCVFINHLGKMPSHFQNVHFHNAALESVFPAEVRGMLSPVEYANLEMKQSSSVAFVYLITYLKGHNEILVEKLQPIPLEVVQGAEENMILSHNTANQLDLDAGLQTWVNKCQTAMGKRYLSHRLLNPSYNVDLLTQSYGHVSFFLDTLGMDKVEKHRRAMTGMMDLERLLRMMELNNCRVQHMAFFYKSMRALQSILSDEEDAPHFERDTQYLAVKPALEDILTWLESIFTVVDDDGTINDSDRVSFKTGVSTSLDCLNAKMIDTDALLDEIVADLNKLAGTTAPIFKKEVNEREGQYLTCTNKRWEEAKKKPNLMAYVHSSGAFAFTDLKKCPSNTAHNATKISCDLFQDSLRICRACAFDIERETRQLLTEHIGDFLQNFKTPLREIFQTVREMDFHMTAAYIAFKYRFTRPEIDADAEKPFIMAQNVRHPIVERIQQDVTYVGNDVCIGHEPSGKGHQGMLLYGLNAAGKSTLMKSLALSVILAQAGFYVPASSYRFHPYRSLFSRITRGDDINRGQSTFTIEMQELRNIMRRSDSYSLIIGDEVCSGTETASAIAIVSAGLHQMIHKNDATFIFATHYHDLTSVPLVKALYAAQKDGGASSSPLGIFHLHVNYDPVTQKLIYDRTLKPGQGRTTYGIEVCRALNLEASFIEIANQVRQEYTARGHKSALTHVQESRYNANFFSPAQTCTVCGKKEKNEDYHVHHIHYQKDADEHGYIKTFHKNQLSNLVLLCESCHDKVHRDEICIKGWTTSSHGGRELIVTEIP